jgi:undecaprenyl-phosphate 4-deoxy-4-formamido-L-arabinose transferase
LTHARPDLSLVIPVYNEQDNLPRLQARLVAVLRGIGRRWEIVYVDDGSRDRSLDILRGFAAAGEGRVRVIELYRNAGQFSALAAGLEQAEGAVVVTLDADLQNPPEEIPRLLAAIDEGHDVVNGWRKDRHDSAFRRFVSRIANGIARAVTGLAIHDYGCMLRACRREVVDQVVAFRDHAPYLPVLANTCARRPVEIPVAHAGRHAGVSKYPLRKLIALQCDMLASLPGQPLRPIALAGAVLGFAACGAALAIALLALLLESGAVVTLGLAAVLFFLVGLLFLAVAVVAEYTGRTWDLARQRPRAVVRRVHGVPGRPGADRLEEAEDEVAAHPAAAARPAGDVGGAGSRIEPAVRPVADA